MTYVNGEERSRTVLSQRVSKNPITEVIALGTGQKQQEQQVEIGDGYIRLPSGEVLTYTRTDTVRATAYTHTDPGCDLITATGTHTVRATAYTHTDPGCDLITATGTQVRRGTVAVDPRYIPYGTRMFIMASDGSYIYGVATAEDCGGDIKGDRMDLYLPTFDECIQFGRRRRMFIMASDGSYIYGVATAEDCGGDIKGDRMDLYLPTFDECIQFGRRRCTLYFLE